jgi:hypothetical protein
MADYQQEWQEYRKRLNQFLFVFLVLGAGVVHPASLHRHDLPYLNPGIVPSLAFRMTDRREQPSILARSSGISRHSLAGPAGLEGLAGLLDRREHTPAS